ncbi:MAG TPA: hypothetical protein VGS79_08770 [Puia sp.]|nr:hypothetical protein [Puia sp.]
MRKGLLVVFALLPFWLRAQNFEKVVFDQADSANGYYLAVRPLSGLVKGVVVFFTWYTVPESIPPETKLHNVAAVNGLLTIYASTGRHVAPSAVVLERMNRLFTDVMNRYKVDSSAFAIGGGDMAGLSVLRYAELAQEHPEQYVIRPKAVFGISPAVDLGGDYRILEREIRKNYPSPSLGDAQAILPMLKKEMGTIEDHAEDYARWTPFDHTIDGPGNERFLARTAVRLYYDADIEWRLRARRDSYYDTDVPNGSELIDRLLLAGNNRAEFVAGNRPAIRSNGNRSSFAFSMIDEVDCIQWLTKELQPYYLPVLNGSRGEQYPLPPDFAPKVFVRGIEDLRLAPGWGTAGAPDYWSAAALYWLNAGQKIDESVLQQNIQAYYEGLVVTGAGPVKHHIPADKMVPTKVEMKVVKTEAGDVTTYAGTIDMLDYMAMKPMRLNLMVHVLICDNPNHVPVLLQFSPKPYDDEVWISLKQVKEQFRCQ